MIRMPKRGLLLALTAALAACSSPAPEEAEAPPPESPENFVPPPAPLPEPSVVETPSSDTPPAPRPTGPNGCELVQMPGHTENPGQLNSRYVPGPMVELCPPPPLIAPGRALPLPPSSEAVPNGARTRLRLYAVA